MARLPYAAKTLIAQATARKPRTKAEPHGDVDGLGVHRTIKFNKETSKFLAPLLEQIDDERIEDFEVTEAGYLHVTFVATPDADQRAEFPLSAAEEVAASSGDEE